MATPAPHQAALIYNGTSKAFDPPVQGALDALNAQDDSKVDPTQRAQLEQLINQADAALVQYKEQ